MRLNLAHWGSWDTVQNALINIYFQMEYQNKYIIVMSEKFWWNGYTNRNAQNWVVMDVF